MDFSATLTPLFDKLESWYNDAIAVMPNIAIAIVCFILFVIAARYIEKITFNISSRISHSGTVSNLFSFLLKVAVILLGLFFSLGILGLQTTVVSLLAGAGVVGIVLGFGFQDITLNFVAGIMLGMKKPFRINQLIKINDIFGYARAVTLRSTTIETREGQYVTIPNKEVFQSKITNYDFSGYMRIKFDVGISYNDDLEFVSNLIERTISSLDFVLKNHPVNVFTTEFEDYSIKFSIRFWVAQPSATNFREARSIAMKATKRALDAEGIVIPFPIRDVRMSQQV